MRDNHWQKSNLLRDWLVVSIVFLDINKVAVQITFTEKNYIVLL